MITTISRRKLKKTLGNIIFLISYLLIGDLLAINFYDIDFAWVLSPYHYLLSIITVLTILEICSWANNHIDVRFPWAKRAFTRFLFLTALAFGASFGLSPALIFLSNLVESEINFDKMVISYSILNNWGLTCMILIFDLVTLLLKQWRQSIIEVERFKKESIEFRFETLKNQVNPHFLFNSLNTLSSLMHIDIEAAEKFLRQLSKVYRYVLENRDQEVINLATELQILDSYIYLVEMRFQDKLKVIVDLPEEAKKFGIPPLTLQMLIENAIKHNELSKEHPLVITITLDVGNYLKVSNPIQLKSSKEYSTKVGLNNIINRYQYLSEKKVVVESGHGKFIIKVPLLVPQPQAN